MDKKLNLEQELKETIKKYYEQIKKGCYRSVCYNEFCKKSVGNIISNIRSYF